MPTTQITEITASVDTVAARTDSAGAAVTPDWKAEERRMAHNVFSEGILTPANAWEPVAGGAATMNVIVGSGSAEVDLVCVVGQVAGQGNYFVRLDEAGKTVVLDAAGASVRQDNIYIVVYDNPYDAQSRTLPRLAVRKGDAGGADPGPDSNWEAYLLVATVTIPAGAADITECTVTDARVQSAFIADVVDTDAVQDGAVTAAKINAAGFTAEFEVDNSTEVASAALTGSFANVASVTLSIPADWGSWKCVAWATWAVNGDNYSDAVLRIDGTDQQTMEQIEFAGGSGRNPAALVGRRSGMTTTGSRSIALRALRDPGTVTMFDIALYARAVRTS